MTADTKAIKAVETLMRYCAERGCNAECVFYNRLSATCQLKVKSPECFPKYYDKTKQNVNKLKNA